MVAFQESQVQVLIALGDALCPSLPPADIQPYLTNSDGVSAAEFGALCPSSSPDFKNRLIVVLGCLPAETAAKVSQVLTILSKRTLALPFTRSTKLLTEMPIAERTKVLIGLRDSRFELFRSLFVALSVLVLLNFARGDETICKAVGLAYMNPAFERLATVPKFRPALLDLETNNALKYDAVVIGSGSSAGVAAYRLTKAGLRVLIVEKADYLDPDHAQLDEMDLFSKCFEAGGFSASRSGNISCLAGSTVGGGAAVNWSCSLDTPAAIRESWASAAPFYNSNKYDEAMGAVRDVMKTTTDIQHSFINNMLLEGSKKLGYSAEVSSQNTGEHDPNTGYIGFGHRYGDKGGVVSWLHYALTHGADLLASARADRIVHSQGKATGVRVLVKGRQVLVNAPRVIVCSGSLHTPVLLQRSGFANKHIGKGLKLHPCCIVQSEFDEVVNKPDDTILTAAVTEFANLDGHNHGPRIEVLQHLTCYMAGFLPWKNGKAYKKDMARLANMCASLVLHRERGAGRVLVASDGNPAYEYNLTKWDLDAMRQGCVAAANIAYVQGCKRIIWPLAKVPNFITARGCDDRKLSDPEYQQWMAKVLEVPFTQFAFPVGSAHQMASCRMNKNGPKYGALDDNGCLYECKNVYVMDASALPSASGTNPMITIMATAWILSGQLLDEIERPRL